MNGNAALGRRWFEEVWNQRRADLIHELATADCLGHHEAPTTSGPALTTRGPHEWTKLYTSLLAAFPDIRVAVEDTVADGDQVVVRWRMQGTHRGAYAGVQSTGRRIDVRRTTWLVCKDGRIAEGWDSWNAGGLLAELGAG